MTSLAAVAAAADGVWIIPGSPYRDDGAVMDVIRHARENGQPLLGTCGGMQYAVVEFVTIVLRRPAAHAEVSPDAAPGAGRRRPTRGPRSGRRARSPST